MDKISGYIKRVRYYSESSHYIVAVVEDVEENEDIVVNGYMTAFNDYEKYVFYGEYVIHPKYGYQFKIDHYETILSDDEDEMIAYLSSPLFKGVGKVLAKRIVDHLGTDAFHKIVEDKHSLDLIKGITREKRDTIYNVLLDQSYDNEVMKFFTSHGISLRYLTLLQSTYKEKTLEVIQNTPYQIIDDIDGIGFKTADDIAIKTGGSLDDPERIKAGIIYSLKQMCFQSGSTYLTYDELKKAFDKIIFHVDLEAFENDIALLKEEEKIVVINDHYYDKDMYEAERYIADTILSFQQYKEEPPDEDVYSFLEAFQKQQGITYGDKQKEAILSFMSSPIMILTGGPGTGKTTIVHAIINIYKKLYPQEKIALLAPTGRAAKRLSELTGLEACTIHRELKWDLNTNVFMMNQSNPLDNAVLIIDEFSMVDTLLFSNLLKASKRASKILLIGDYHQLPSVAPGNLLKELIDSKQVKVVELNDIYRQAQNSGIIMLAHHMINDSFDMSLFQEYPDIHFYNSSSTELSDHIVKIVNLALEQGYDQNDIQVLAPMYQGIAGIDHLNTVLQDVFNPGNGQDEYRIGKKIFRINDKILQLKNRPEDDVYNGDIGTLVEICRKDGFEYLEDTLVVEFDGIFVEYTPKDFFTITHAYCMSIHKSQGNEFKIVILAVLNDYYVMLKRNLIYTGMTRAKQSLFVLGHYQALIKGIENCLDERRKTSLLSHFDNDDHMSIYDFMK